MNENAEKALLGGYVPLPEIDDIAEQQTNSYDALAQYDTLSIIDSIKTPEFKFIFPTLITNIKGLSTQAQVVLCQQILDRIEELYEFKCFFTIPLDSKNDCNEVYLLISHIEYKYFDFISFVWKFLNVDLKSTNIAMYCKNNSNKIISEIEEQIDIRDIPKLFAIFLRTYNKDQLIKWFYNATVENRIELFLNQLSGEDQNE